MARKPPKYVFIIRNPDSPGIYDGLAATSLKDAKLFCEQGEVVVKYALVDTVTKPLK